MRTAISPIQAVRATDRCFAHICAMAAFAFVHSKFQGVIITPLVGLIQLLTVKLFLGELF